MLRMNANKIDFTKLLFSGVKLKKTGPNASTSNDNSELRLRVLPSKYVDEDSDEDVVEEPDDSSEIKLFSTVIKTNPKVKSRPKISDKLKKEQYFDEVRKLNRIFVWGEDIPSPIINFSDLACPPALLDNLKEFHINEPTPIQMQAIPLMFQHRDLLASAPTGSGKTLAFVLPLLKEIFDEVRKLNRIFVWGEDIPSPIINFSDLACPPALLDNLKEFHINEPTPIQMQAIPLMFQHRDLLASAPTGSGKTLAFVLPLLKEIVGNPTSKLFALILEPTRVLAKQVYVQFVKYCQNMDVKYAFFDNGSFPLDAQIVVTTPSRLIDACEKNKKIAERLSELHWIVVDESDRLFNNEDDSVDFPLILGKIFELADGNHTRKAFFSATFSPYVESWCQDNLTNVAMLCIGEKNVSNSTIVQKLVYAGSESGKVSSVKAIIHNGFEPPALIFVHDKIRAGQLYAELVESFPNIPIAMLTSEVPDKKKDKILEEVRAMTTFVLICTELIGRGIDLPTVNLVINFDLPTSIVNYIHRVGRTGRAGRVGTAITYFTESDLKFIRPIATVIHQAGFEVPEYTLSLEKPNAHLENKLKTTKRKRFATLGKWNKVRNKKVKNGEILAEFRIAKSKFIDGDTGGDRVKSEKRVKYIPPKKIDLNKDRQMKSIKKNKFVKKKAKKI
uniref:ATP-dependent RNA helicase n=1 Tax=Panagrolaimus sp. JU765 TaxID=591449 RepID=A0AC34QWE7_9BILA